MKDRFDNVRIEFIESSGGAFEVTADGDLIYSKLQTGRHATDEEILEALADR